MTLDANVLVAQLDGRDALHVRASALLEDLARRGDRPVLLDVLLGEAVSVLCRRARERKTDPPSLGTVFAVVRAAAAAGEIRFVGVEAERLFDDILAEVEHSGGALNFNDAFLVVLQRANLIDVVATFDEAFGAVPGFRRVS
ncbi:MAG: type II toxin-antitoxin system VapC family toxin [Myxococcales bacterium]|nr:type II toxin-antitoxin system VapC family toxin [Myxococcales bacterium]